MLALQGRVMGTKDTSARLCEQAARQAKDLSILENFRVGTCLFCSSLLVFFLQPISELVTLLSELGGKVKMLERDLETIKVTISRNAEELAKSCEERRALEGGLDQIHNVAQLVISDVFGSVPSTSAPAVQLVEISDVVWDLIRSELFYGASGVLTSVAMHQPNLDFAAICSGYVEGLSMEDFQSIGEGLLPHARSVEDQVSAQWVMDVRREDMARSMRGEDAA